MTGVVGGMGSKFKFHIFITVLVMVFIFVHSAMPGDVSGAALMAVKERLV